MSYLSSPLWMMLLLVGFALTLQATLIRPEYFSRSFQLFPDWPRFDAPRMTALFLYTMVVLFTPKILGLIRTIFSSRARRGCGGVIAVGIGAVVETILSALYAPIMMLVQTQHIIEILTGRAEQIRIHLAWIGHPLVGDPMYCAGGLPRAEDPGLPGDGGYLLHAEWLAFTHPLSGERLRLHAPPPPALEVGRE